MCMIHLSIMHFWLPAIWTTLCTRARRCYQQAADLPIILGAVLFQKLCCFLSEYIRKGSLILFGIRPPVVT